MIKNISNLGDAALYCDFGIEVNKKINSEVIKYFKAIKEKNIIGINNLTPSYNKLIISYDLQLTNLDKIFQVIIKSAIFEFLYKPKISTKIIIKEYLNASNFFLDDSQTKYLNAILDKIAKKIRKTNA